MSKVTMIAAIGMNNEIGYKNELLWRLKTDLKFFKSYTLGKTIIMGRKTFESIGSKPLPGRLNVVVTTDKNYQCDGVLIANSPLKALELASNYNVEICIIGGEKIYKSLIDQSDSLVITHVLASAKRADAFFPDAWIVSSRSLTLIADSDNEQSFRTVYWERK